MTTDLRLILTLPLNSTPNIWDWELPQLFLGWLRLQTMQKYEKLEKIGEGKTFFNSQLVLKGGINVTSDIKLFSQCSICWFTVAMAC